MELVLIGLSGSGKTTLARALARRAGAEAVDLDAEIERRAGRSVSEIFAADGESTFRALEAAAIADLRPPAGAADDGRLRRVIAAGGGAVVDPAGRWRLFEGRRVVWLDAPADALAERVGVPGEAGRRPLLVGRPAERLAALGAARARFYRAGLRVDATGPPEAVLSRLEAAIAAAHGGGRDGTRLLDAETDIGRIVIGAGVAAGVLGDVLAAGSARRVALLSEPRAWQLHGQRLATGLAEAGLAVEPILLPGGERAKTLRALEGALRALAQRHLERRDPIVAVGGGALGDAAGFAAATYLRGVPLIHVPTTLLAQLDSSIGGKTAVDLPEGKNLVGAFYQPAAVVIDLDHLATLPARQIRAALGEAAKMAALGDERLLARLEADGPRLCRADGAARPLGALAEVVERSAWAKVEVVLADEREIAGNDGRIRLNLGHSFGHAIEAAAGYRRILHGQAVAHGLRGALSIGRAVGLTPPDRAERLTALLDRLGLAVRPARVATEAVRAHLAVDKKVAGGRLRWVLPTADGVAVTTDVPDGAVEAGLRAALAGRGPGHRGAR